MIGAVFFDAVGTLLHADPAPAVVYARAASRFGSRLSAASIAPRFQEAWLRQEAADWAAGLRTSEHRELERWRAIVAEVLVDVVDPEACFLELYRHFAQPEAWRVASQAVGVLEQLAKEGMLLGMTSNFDGRLRAVLAGKPELRAITQLVISSEVGWRKPAPEFYAAALAATGLPATSILHVGDDPENDVAGPVKAGMKAVLLDPQGRRPRATPKCIDDLRDLKAIIHSGGQ